MKIKVFLSALLLGVTAQAASFSLTNLGPEFRTYIQTYRTLDSEAQWQGWKEFHTKHSQHYNVALCDLNIPKCETTFKNLLTQVFAELPQFENQMWHLFDHAQEIAAAQTAKFKTAFPDLDNDMPVVFLPSIGGFNGKVVPTDQRSILFIGVDYIAKKGNNIDVLFSHEFFHAYQFDKLKNKKKFQTLAAPLWVEGLGTWVSGHLNPGASFADVLMNEELAKFCQPKALALLAREYRDVLKQQLTEENAHGFQRDWFTMSGSRPGPHRQGYCLGNFVIERVLKKYSLAKIVEMDEDQFYPVVLEALDQMAIEAKF